MGQQNIGPIIYESFVCGDIGVIFMEKMGGTMDVNKLTEEDVARVVELVLQMHELGFTHNDLKSANVLYKIREDGTKEWRLSDFGMTFMNSSIDYALKQKVVGNWDWMEKHYYNDTLTIGFKDDAFEFISKEVIQQHPDAIDALFLYILLRLYNSKEVVEEYLSGMTQKDMDDEDMMDTTVSFQEDISI